MTKKYKPYKEIFEQRASPLLLKGKEEKGLTTVSQNTDMITAELGQGLTPAVLSSLSERIPGASYDMVLSNEGIPEENRQSLANIKNEVITDAFTVQRRRSDTEKRQSVLQSNRHTTAAARFHQAKLESVIQYSNLSNNTMALEKKKIELETLKYKYDRLLDKINTYSNEGKDTFLLEQKCKLLKIKIFEELQSYQSLQSEAESLSYEILEWSKIKEENYNEAMASGETWSPENVDVGSDIFLSNRFFRNFLIAHQSAPDSMSTSDILNIDGLAVGALKEGLKNQTLGSMLNDFNDEQIKFIVGRLMGIDILPIRNAPDMKLIAMKNTQTEELFVLIPGYTSTKVTVPNENE